MHAFHGVTGMAGTHDMPLVGLSVCIAIVSAYAALDLGGRVTAAAGRLRAIWLTGGAVAMGSGIWAMHYVGMLAYQLPVSVSYHWPTVVLSLVASVLASAVALFVISRDSLKLLHTGFGGLLMGSGIAAMHYIGMDAMRLSAISRYDFKLVAVSVVLAVVISLIALWLTFHLRAESRALALKKLCSSLLMGSAIPVMHYTGMAAVSFHPITHAVDRTDSIEITALGIIGIATVALLILTIAIVTSLVDRRFSSQALELHRSEERYRQLVESARVILWRGDPERAGLNFVNAEAESVLGYPLAAWIAAPGFWLKHIHPDDRDMTLRCLRKLADGATEETLEHRMLSADGGVVWLRTSVRITRGTQEFVGVMTDITDRKIAEEAAQNAKTEIERLNEQLKRENSRMTAELDVSRRLQQMILPKETEIGKIPNLDVSGMMEPAEEVGGDYYDVIERSGNVLFSIGDVTGHGLESGVVAIMVQTAVRTLLESGPYDSHRFLTVLNTVLYDNVARMQCDRNVTLNLLHFEDNEVTVCGQHEEIIVVRENGALERHDTLDLGFPLGLEENIVGLIGQSKLPLNPGDVLVAYTDGITEAVNLNGVCFGVDRLAQVIAENHKQSSRSIRDAVLDGLRAHIGSQRLLDDISMLVVKPTGEPTLECA